MKKTAFLFLAFLTFYLAAMYRLLPLMILCLAELLFIVCMWILPRYLKRYIRVVIQEHSVAKTVSEEHGCCCNVVNDGKLPVSRVRIRVRVRYLQEKKGDIKYLCSAAESGANNIHFAVRAPYCGAVCLTFDRIQIYDYLTLFSSNNVLSEEIKIAILPEERPMYIDLSSFAWNSENVRQENTVRCIGDAHHEMRQIREYQTGDSYRHIHWNHSAKTDKIWIKEYEKEIDSCIGILLENDVGNLADPKKMDAFYRLLHSVILGLLGMAQSVKVYWYAGYQNQLTETEIRDAAWCHELFLRLYQINFFDIPVQEAKVLFEEYAFTHDNYFKLDTELCWYWNETRIYQFSVENLEQEIAQKRFAL